MFIKKVHKSQNFVRSLSGFDYKSLSFKMCRSIQAKLADITIEHVKKVSKAAAMLHQWLDMVVQMKIIYELHGVEVNMNGDSGVAEEEKKEEVKDVKKKKPEEEKKEEKVPENWDELKIEGNPTEFDFEGAAKSLRNIDVASIVELKSLKAPASSVR